MKVLLTIAMSMILSISVSAMTLDDAVSLTLKNDESLKQQKMQMESQKFASLGAGAAFLPSADLSYSYTKSHTYDNTQKQLDDTEQKASSAGINITYNLFNGFMDVNNARISQNAYEAQKYLYQAKRQDIILAVKKAYVAYLQSKNDVEVASETLQLLEAQKKTAEISFKVGQFARTDVLKVDVQLASSKLDLMNAQINFKLARQQLEKYIGQQLAADEVATDVELRDYVVPGIDELYKILESNRSELLATKASHDGAAAATSRQWGNFLPKVNAVGSHSWKGDANNPFDGQSSDRDPDEVSTIGVTASWNIFHGFADTNAYLAQSKSEQAAAHSVYDVRSNLRLALSDAYESYFSAKEMLLVATVGVAQADENYRVTQTQYANSEATTTDLLDASVALNRARTSFARAKYAIITAVATLERSVETDFLGLKIQEDAR